MPDLVDYERLAGRWGRILLRMIFLALVPETVADALVDDEMAEYARVTRGAGQIVVETLTNTAVLITLLQAPDTLLRLEELLNRWRSNVRNEADEGSITIRKGVDQVVLEVGDSRGVRELADAIEDALDIEDDDLR